MSTQFGPPFLPGTFWEIHGRRYVIDPAYHWVRLDEPVLFRIPPMAPDTAGAIQLQLVPVVAGPHVELRHCVGCGENYDALEESHVAHDDHGRYETAGEPRPASTEAVSRG